MAMLEERWRRVDQARAHCGEESMRKERSEEKKEGPCEPVPGAAAGKCMNDSTARTEPEWHLMSVFGEGY